MAQVQYINLSFEKACRQAAKEKKVVMMVMESADCAQCNEVAQRGLSQPEAFAINAMAIPLLVGTESRMREKIYKRFYTSDEGFGLLYFNADGRLIHRWNKSSTAAHEYVTQTTLAYKKRNLPAPDLTKLEQRVKKDPDNSEAVLQLYEARKENGDLVIQMADQYARASTPAWKDSVTIIRTLIQLQPILATYADSMMRYANKPLFNKLWYEQPLQERVEANRIIIARTGTQAITDKNLKLAYINASFAAGILDNAPMAERLRTSQSMMAVYYKNVNDTLSYLYTVERLMTQYYMRLDADSVQKADSIRGAQALNQPTQMVKVDSVLAKGSFNTVRTFAPRAQFIARSVNTYCWHIYKMKPNSVLTEKAINWASHGLHIYQSPELYDTYARLLYMHGRKDEAIAAQEKAIALTRKREKLSASNFIRVLEAMKAGQPVFDLE